MDYDSTVTQDAQSVPGVTYTIQRMSFARRLELMKRVREASAALEFHAAGETLRDRVDAVLSEAEANLMYLRWGLVRLDGLTIDGEAATPELLVAAGPEALCREIVAAVKQTCFLTEEARKN